MKVLRYLPKDVQAWDPAYIKNVKASKNTKKNTTSSGCSRSHKDLPQSLLWPSEMRSMMVALAVPPPSQMVKRPYLPCCLSNSWTSVVMSLTPVAPSGWPRAMAPPFTLNFSRLPPKNVFATAKGTDAKASLTSTTEMSSGLRLAFLRTASVAGTGPSNMMVGSDPTTAIAVILALGLRPSFFKPSSLQTKTAAQPSQIWLLVAGVRRPLGNIGFIEETLS
mmetsp:Transcript_37847/g.56520  ORF Transcript_37847/g.56520 Transcript_37847/m.56520 type:complete len:221 (-) Transcript_37847:805-1467(-)